MPVDPIPKLAKEFHLREGQVGAVVEMLDAGRSIPFIARYRKGRIGNLDAATLREIPGISERMASSSRPSHRSRSRCRTTPTARDSSRATARRRPRPAFR